MPTLSLRRSPIIVFVVLLLFALSTQTAFATTGTISGTVTTSDNITPIPNMHVTAHSRSFSYSSSTCTDSNGDYEFTDAPVDTNIYVYVAGPYQDVCGGSTIYALEYYGGAFYTPDGTPILIQTPGGSFTSADISMDVGGSISGTVTATDGGAALSGIRVFVVVESQQEIGSWILYANACTDSNGNYTITNVPINFAVKLFTWDDICGTSPENEYSRRWWDGSADRLNADAITIANQGGTFTNGNFTLDLTASVSGTVLDTDGVTPVENAEIWIVDDLNEFPISACTDANGNYTLSGITTNLDQKMYTGYAYNNCIGSLQDIIPVYYNQVTTSEEATVLNFTPGQQQSGINFTLISTATTPTNLSPNAQDLAIAPVFPTFTWTGLNDATQYRLYMWNGSKVKIIDQTFAAGEICSGLNCQLTDLDYSSINRWGLLNNNYEWWIGAKLQSGLWAWSDKASFTVNVPQPNFPANITVDPAQGRPVITWDYDPTMLWVDVWVGPHPAGNYRAWHELNGPNKSYTCDTNTNICTLVLPWDVAGKDAQSNPYNLTVWMRGWGPGGYGIGENPPLPNAPQWNSSSSFNLPTNAAGTPTEVTGENGEPTFFTWTSGTHSTWYHLIIQPQGGGANLHSSWHQASTVTCDGAAEGCELYLNLVTKLTSGQTYQVQVRAWGPGGFSSYSGALDFLYSNPA